MYANSRSILLPHPYTSRVLIPFLNVSGVLDHSKGTSKLAKRLKSPCLGNADSVNLQWEKIAGEVLAGADAAKLEYVNEEVTAAEDSLTIAGLASPDPRTTEDCLFLDVIAPETIFNQNTSAPVLVWIYGGGYVNGR
jgi:acetyl esterase/lipase